MIFRPSFVFGRDGGALQQFSRIAKLSPVTPIVGPGTQRIQPIWVDDVAAYFAAGVELPEAANRTFELGGPDVVTWNEFWSRLKRRAGSAAAVAPPAVRPDARPGGGAREAAEPPVTRDQLTMLDAGDNVVTNSDAVDTFGLPLVPLDEQLAPRRSRKTDVRQLSRVRTDLFGHVPGPGPDVGGTAASENRRRAAFAALQSSVPACIGRDASCQP